jgi:hypothetical protein
MGFTPDINTIDWDLSEHTYWYEYEFDGGAHDTYMEQSFVNGFVIQTFICNDELIITPMYLHSVLFTCLNVNIIFTPNNVHFLWNLHSLDLNHHLFTGVNHLMVLTCGFNHLPANAGVICLCCLHLTLWKWVLHYLLHIVNISNVCSMNHMISSPLINSLSHRTLISIHHPSGNLVILYDITPYRGFYFFM